MSYYTPPPSAGGPWSQPSQHMPSFFANAISIPSSHAFVPQSNGIHIHDQHHHQQEQQANMHQVLASMYATMMQQQMQNFPLAFNPQTQTNLSAAVDPQTMRVPQPSDNNLLAQVLYEQTKRGLTYKGALESLHGHNGIAAFAWKDYYLENKLAIDQLVGTIKSHVASQTTVKQEQVSASHANDEDISPASRQRVSVEMDERQPKSSHLHPNAERIEVLLETQSRPLTKEGHFIVSSSPSPSRSRKSNEPTSTSTPREEHEQANTGVVELEAGSSRRTLNSLASTPGQDLIAAVPAGVPIDPRTGLPGAPSRSPSPPAGSSGSRYTKEDAVFFYRRIAYDLKRLPDPTKADLCDILGEKAPHHTALSWRTYWSRHENVADKMLLLTMLDDEDREEMIHSWKTGKPITTGSKNANKRSKRSTYVEGHESEYESDTSSEDLDAAGSHSDSETDEDEEEDAQGSTDDGERLGGPGDPFTKAEVRALAKYIVTQSGWYRSGRIRNWDNFTSKVCACHLKSKFHMLRSCKYTMRSPASWREFYRRRATDVDSIVVKYKKKARKQRRSSIRAQRGRPSWSKRPRSSDENKTSKRQYSDSEEDQEHSEGKRARVREFYD